MHNVCGWRERKRERISFLLLRKLIKYADIVFLNCVVRAFKDHTWEAIMRDINSPSRWRKNCKNGKISRNLSSCKILHLQEQVSSGYFYEQHKTMLSLPLGLWNVRRVSLQLLVTWLSSQSEKLLAEGEDENNMMEKWSWQIAKQRPDGITPSVIPKCNTAQKFFISWGKHLLLSLFFNFIKKMFCWHIMNT